MDRIDQDGGIVHARLGDKALCPRHGGNFDPGHRFQVHPQAVTRRKLAQLAQGVSKSLGHRIVAVRQQIASAQSLRGAERRFPVFDPRLRRQAKHLDIEHTHPGGREPALDLALIEGRRTWFATGTRRRPTCE